MKMENMLKYQQIDGQIKEIAKTMNASEAFIRGKKLGNYLKDAEENLKRMNKRAEELSALVQKMQNNYAQATKDFEDLEKGVEQAIDKEELNYLTKKLGDTSRSIAAIEKDIASAISEMEAISKKYDELHQKVPVARTQYKECRDKFEQLKKENEPKVNALKEQQRELEKQIDPKVFDIYQQYRNRNVFPVFVPLSPGNRCGGCMVDMSVAEKDRLGTVGYVRCENCGRLIYKE